MFRIKDGKIKVFAKYVELRPGTHTVKVDKNTGSISYETGDDVVRYTFDENTGDIAIESLLGPVGYSSGEPPTKARSWMNGRMLSSGPLYKDPTGAGGSNISVYLEGFAFDFDYNGVAHVVSATKPFRWTGGRVCFDDMFGSGGFGNSQAQYTAIPAAGSCGRSFIDTYDNGLGQVADIAGIYGGGTSGLMKAASKNVFEYYGNSVSIVFSYRSFRKYLSWARGLTGIFECSLGPIGTSSGDIEPDGSFPDTFDAGFKFSMFNLRQ